MASEDADTRIIKKYPNRRLYDTEASRYITLSEVRELILAEKPFVVLEQKSGEDVTRSILLQIILEQESDNNPLFTNENLERFTRYYGSMPQQTFTDFMGKSLQFFMSSSANSKKPMPFSSRHWQKPQTMRLSG